jgi:hypothetical protein
VHFKDGSAMADVGEIICCTGYKMDFDYIDKEVMDSVLGSYTTVGVFEIRWLNHLNQDW